MHTKNSLSNILIIISAIITLLATIKPELYIFGINTIFLDNGLYHIYIIQFFTGTFLHIGVLHLLSNSIFLYFFGNIIEIIIGKKKFLLFFLFVVMFSGVLVSTYAFANTVGISGFCMALLVYYTLELKSKKNPEYKGGITAIVISILIGLNPGISLYGHLFGSIAGLIFYLLNKEYFKRKMSGLITKKS